MDVPHLLAQWQQQLVAHTPLPTALCAIGLLLLLVPKLRRVVFDVLETVIATFLLLVLIIVVLGLPFGELPEAVHQLQVFIICSSCRQLCAAVRRYTEQTTCLVTLPCGLCSTLTLCALCRCVLCLAAAASYIAFKGVVFTLRSISSSLPHLFDFVSVAAQQVSQHA